MITEFGNVFDILKQTNSYSDVSDEEFLCSLLSLNSSVNILYI